MSCGISGCKQDRKFNNTSNRVGVCLFSQNKTTILVMQNLQLEVWRDLRLYCLLLGQIQSLLHTILHPKKATMITSTHNLPLLSLKQSVFLIIFCCTEKTNSTWFLVLANSLLPEKPGGIAFILPVLKRVQRWWISWLRSVFVDNKLPLPTLDLMALSRSKTEEKGNSLFMPKSFCNEG